MSDEERPAPLSQRHSRNSDSTTASEASIVETRIPQRRLTTASEMTAAWMTNVHYDIRSTMVRAQSRQSSLFMLEKRLAKRVSVSDEKSAKSMAGRALSFLLVSMVPLSVGSFPGAMVWAQKHSDSPDGFSKFTPVAVGNIIAMLVFFLALCFMHGPSAARLMYSRRYVATLVPGVLIGVTRVLEVSAIALFDDATLCNVILKSNLLHGLWMQALLLGNVPELVHCISTVIVLGLCVSYILSSSAESSLIVSVPGVVFMALAALTDAMSDYGLELGIEYSKSTAAVKEGEGLRCFVSFLLGASLASVAAFFVLDTDTLEATDGFFHGWTYHTVAPVFLHTVRTSFFTVCIMLTGALATNLAASLDVVVAFWFTRFILEIGSSGPVIVILLIMLVLATTNYFLQGLTVQKATNRTLQLIRDEVQEVIREDSMQESMPHAFCTGGLSRRTSCSSQGESPALPSMIQ